MANFKLLRDVTEDTVGNRCAQRALTSQQEPALEHLRERIWNGAQDMSGTLLFRILTVTTQISLKF